MRKKEILVLMNECIKFIFDIIQAVGTIWAIVFAAFQLRKERLVNEKEQASYITCWVPQEDSGVNQNGRSVEIVNNSQQSIYNVAISIDSVHFDSRHVSYVNQTCTYIHIIPPGRYSTNAYYGGGGMHTQMSVSISFTDACGRHWYRNAWGNLEKKKHDAIYERKISLPITSAKLQKIKDE